MKKIGLVSLGCAKNLVDSEMILAMFDKTHFQITSDPKEADLIIINTCAFIESAKKESIDTIMEMAHHKGKIAVVGCLAQRYAKELANILPEADVIIPIDDYKEINQILSKLVEEDEIAPLNPLERIISTPSYSAYLRISDGCNNFCSFCAIPYIRGTFKSRPFDEIIEEAKLLKKKGYKEISIISQDTTYYGRDLKTDKKDILDLLKELDHMGFYSIRLLYLYPSEISDELIQFIASSRSISHYFDIPVQCASDHLLKAMNRKGSAIEMRTLFNKIKTLCPDAILRTTLIAGFPGENEEDQKETLDFLNEVRFDHLGVFTYSREEGTRGYSMKPIVPEKLKQKRKDELMELQAKISYQNNKARIGEVMEGLIIGEKDGYYLLRSSWNAPDEIDGSISFSSSKKHQMGEVAKVKITNCFVYDLMGVETE